MTIVGRGAFAAVALLACTPVAAKTWYATATTYKSIFTAAKAGDTIRLTGSFGRTVLQNRSFATTLTIDARGASFTDTLSFTNVAGIKLYGGTYRQYPTTAVAIRVSNSDRVVLYKPVVSGNGTSRHGIDVGNSTNITVDGGTFTGLGLGVGFTSVTGGKVINNKSIGSFSDGFDFADSHQILVSRNSCSGGATRPGAHPDCVQLWSIAGRKPTSDIEISDNTASGPTQGFTSFDPEAGGGDRILFLRNRVDISYPQGIACYNCRDSVVTGNVLTSLAGSKYRATINIVGGSRNSVTNNSIGPQPTVRTLEADTVVAARFADYAGPTEVAAARFAGALLPSAVAAVPEPGTWLMMIAGFGLTGAAARRRRAVRPA